MTDSFHASVLFLRFLALPIILYAQVNPLHLKFDVDTVIWLNAFFLSLTTNLVSLYYTTCSIIEIGNEIPCAEM